MSRAAILIGAAPVLVALIRRASARPRPTAHLGSVTGRALLLVAIALVARRRPAAARRRRGRPLVLARSSCSAGSSRSSLGCSRAATPPTVPRSSSRGRAVAPAVVCSDQGAAHGPGTATPCARDGGAGARPVRRCRSRCSRSVRRACRRLSRTFLNMEPVVGARRRVVRAWRAGDRLAGRRHGRGAVGVAMGTAPDRSGSGAGTRAIHATRLQTSSYES